jgi:hypothetical protein
MIRLSYVISVSIILISAGCGNNDKSVVSSTEKRSVSTENKAYDNKSAGEKSDLQTISSKEVKSRIGDSLIIKGFIADIYLSDKAAYLNFEEKFPKNIFSCVIFENKFAEFGDLSKYKNRVVEVTGKITSFKNKPQVILFSKEQLNILN